MKPIVFEYGAPMEIDRALQLTEGIPLKVSGTAVDETISYNDIYYEGVELEKSANTLIGKPLLKDHRNEVEAIIGRVVGAKYIPEERRISYEAEVMDEKIKEMIKDGRINTVSIGARVKDLEETEQAGRKIMKATGLEFMELSVVAVQGVPNASLTTANFQASLTEALRGVDMKEQEPVAPAPVAAPVAPPVAPAVPQVDKVAQLEQQIALIMQEIERLKQVIGASTPSEKLKEQEEEEDEEEEEPKKEEEEKVKQMEILEQKLKTLQETVGKLGGIKGEVADVGEKEETLIIEKGSTGIAFYDKKKGTAKNYKEFLKG